MSVRPKPSDAGRYLHRNGRLPDRVAIVHDWLNGMRGGEKALEAILELFPQADIFTLLLDRQKISPAIANKKITTSFIQRIPLAQSKYRHLLPLFPLAVQSFDLSGYDLVISTSHCVAKGARPPKGALHICYCFSPMRYVWVFQEEYFRLTPVKGFLLLPLIKGLRRWDRRSNDRVHHFVAISSTVADRIAKFYGRGSEVIFPPVDTDFFVPEGQELTAETAETAENQSQSHEPPSACSAPSAVPPPTRKAGEFFLVVSALVPYKRVDIAIKAFAKLRLPLVVIGDGPEYRRLKRMSGENVSFRGWVTDPEVREAYQSCRALIFPGVEDFGLTPIEAQACGKPVIAFGKGGVTESVLDRTTGILFRDQTVRSLIQAVNVFQKTPFDTARIRQNSLRFSRQVFKTRLMEYISRRYQEFRLDRGR